MSIPIIDSLFLGSNIPLDSRSVVSLAEDVSKYFHAGFYGFETGNDLPFYIDNSLNVRYFLTSDSSLIGDFATIEYVDGSLALRDASIDKLFTQNISQDASIDLINSTYFPEASLGFGLFYQDGVIDVSLADAQGVSQAYVDGSLALRDASIDKLFDQNFLRESSLGPQFYFQDGSLYVDVSTSVEETVGGILGLGSWSYNSAFQFAPPASGEFRLDNATVSSATTLWIHDFDRDSVDRGNLLNFILVPGTLLYFQQINNKNNYFIAEVSSNTDSGTYVTASITDVQVTGSTPVAPYIVYAYGNTGSDISKEYIDGSLGARDASIDKLFEQNEIQDASIDLINSTYFPEASLGFGLFYQDGVIDVSLADAQGVSQAYVDGSLALRDASIDKLFGQNEAQDASIINISNRLDVVDGSIEFLDSSVNQLFDELDNIDASLDLYVLKSGDVMTGPLTVQDDVSVSGKGYFNELNVSGDTFPGSPQAGDKFYRTDLDIDFAYDGSRGKWLSVQRNTYSAGENRINASATRYFQVGEAVMDSITGIHVWENGVITKISVQNNRTVAGAGKSIELRVNDSTTYKETLTITAGNNGARRIVDLDVSAGDILQVISVPGSDRIDDVIFNFEIAIRE